MYIFYKICKYVYDNPDYINDRMGIEDYVGTIGKDLENYFFWENHFVKVYQNYLKYFGDTVATKIFFSDIDLSIPSIYMERLVLPIDELDILKKLSFDNWSERQREFAFQCSLRGLISIFFFTRTSHLVPMEDSFYVQLKLPDDADVNEFIPKDSPLFVYYDLDHWDSSLNVIPENCGQKLNM